MKFIQFDVAGRIVARFDEDPAYLPHPDGTVEVDEALWERTFTEINGVWSRSAETGEVIKEPFPSVEVAPQTKFTARAFAKRFTMNERIAIRQASLEDMEVGLIYDDFNRAEYINIEDPDVAAALDLYVSKGLLHDTRKAELLTPGSFHPGEDLADSE